MRRPRLPGPPRRHAATSAAPVAAAAPPVSDAAERRQLTVMFCDLVGSTSLSTRVDPEDLRDLMRSFQERAAAQIAHFDGFIARYMGDGILVYFGYPRAHEDDAERCVRAALGIVDGVRRPRGRGAPGDRHRPGGGRRSDRRRCLGGTDGGGRDAQPGGAPASAGAPGRDRHLAGHPRSVARTLRRRSAGTPRAQGIWRSGAGLRGQARARRREPLRGPPPGRAGPADRTGTRAGPAGGSLVHRPRRGRPGRLARRRGGPRQVAPAGGAGAGDRQRGASPRAPAGLAAPAGQSPAPRHRLVVARGGMAAR